MKEKNLCVVFRPNIRGFVNRTERWLANMAEKGLRLEKMEGWSFSFRKCKPYQAKFFMYSAFSSHREINYDYLSAKQKYNKADSKLNKTPNGIFEVDLNKMDNHFSFYIRSRNRFYLRQYLLLLLAWSVLFIASLVSFEGIIAILACAIPLLAMIYSSISVLGLLFFK